MTVHYVSSSEYKQALRESPAITGLRLLVAFVMSEHCTFASGANCHPSMSTVADEIGLSRSRVNDHVKALERDGWLTATGKVSRSGAKVYQLSVPDDVTDHVPQGVPGQRSEPALTNTYPITYPNPSWDTKEPYF